MAEFHTFDLASVKASALGASDAMPCGHIRDLTFTASGTGSWSLDIEVSTDGTNWTVAHSGVTLGDIVTVAAAVSHCRANTISWASGAPGLRVTGHS